MPSYKVLDCKFKKTFDGQRGTFSVYNLKLSDGTNPIPTEAELVQLPKTAEPQQGQTLEGTLEPSEYGWKFKRDRRSPSEAPRSPSKANGRQEPYRKHPAEVAAVQRAHAQEMALRYMALAPEQFTEPTARKQVLTVLIDWFEADVNKAMELAELPPAEVQLRDQASRLADAGEKAAYTAEQREADEDRVRGEEIIAANVRLKKMDHV